jgi:hypothetical protein
MVISEGGLDYKAVRISVRRLLLTRASVDGASLKA